MDSRIPKFAQCLTQLLGQQGWETEMDEDFIKLKGGAGQTVMWLKFLRPAGDSDERAIFSIWLQTHFPGGRVKEAAVRERIQQMVEAAQIRFQQVSFEEEHALWLNYKCYSAYFNNEATLLSEVQLFIQSLESFARLAEYIWQEAHHLNQICQLEHMKSLLGDSLKIKNFAHQIAADGSVLVSTHLAKCQVALRVSICHINLSTANGLDFTFQVESIFPGNNLSEEGRLMVGSLLTVMKAQDKILSPNSNRIIYQHRFHPYVFADHELLNAEIALLIEGIESLFHTAHTVWQQVFVHDSSAIAARKRVLRNLMEWECFHHHENAHEIVAWIKCEIDEMDEFPDYLLEQPFLNSFTAWLALEFSFNKSAA